MSFIPMGRVNLNRQLSSSRIAILITILAVIATLSSGIGPAMAFSHTSSGPGESTVEGALFPLPESMEDEVEDYRQQVPQGLAPHASVLATQDKLYIVFTDSKQDAGRATVTGQALERGISANGLQFSVIKANSISVETTGQEATVEDVANNPQSYQLNLVRIDATHRRIAVLNDPDQGEDVTVPLSAGALVENPTTASEISSQPAKKARSLGINSSTDALGSSTDQEINSLLGTQQPRLLAFNFKTRYWSDTEETVDGIVLTPGSKALEFATTFDNTGILQSKSSEPMLYVVDDERSSQEYSSVQSLKQNAQDGDVVSIQANLYGQRISIQETLEESTPCGQSQAQVPSPSGPVCVDIVQDTLVDAGVAWTSTPESRDSVVFVVGLSSQHLDEQSTELKGQYKITGEVVATSRFDESLPDGKILFVDNVERTADLNYEEISSNARQTIEQQSSTLNTSLANQLFAESGSSEESTQASDSGSTEQGNSESQGSTDQDNSESQTSGETDQSGQDAQSGTQAQQSTEQAEKSVAPFLSSPNQDRIPVISDLSIGGWIIPEEIVGGGTGLIVLIVFLRLF